MTHLRSNTITISVTEYFTSGNISGAIGAAEAVAQEYFSIWNTTTQARGLLTGALQAQAVSSNSNCMGMLEAASGQSFSQLLQDSNAISFIDVTGPSGSLSPLQVGLQNDPYPTLGTEFASIPGATAVTPEGSYVTLLGGQYFSQQVSIDNRTFTTNTPDSFKQSILFHELWHQVVPGAHDATAAGSQAFDTWLNDGCKGQMPQ
jgi:hypothetical protein